MSIAPARSAPSALRDERRGVRRDLVRRHRRDEHEVDVVGRRRRRRSSARRPANVAHVAQALGRARAAARCDAGALDDPGVVDADALGDRGVRHDLGGHAVAEARGCVAVRARRAHGAAAGRLAGDRGAGRAGASRYALASSSARGLDLGRRAGCACRGGRAPCPGRPRRSGVAPASCRASIVSRQRTGLRQRGGQLGADVRERLRASRRRRPGSAARAARPRRARRGTARRPAPCSASGTRRRRRAGARGGRGRGRPPRPRASLSRAPERTTWPGALSLATVTPACAAISRGLLVGRADEREHRAACRRPRPSAGRAARRARSASSRSSTPAAASAASSPSECPAATPGSRLERVPAGEAGAEDRGLGEAGALARRAGTDPRPRARCSARAGRGATRATRSRISGVWLPWPGKSTAGAWVSVTKLTPSTLGCPRATSVSSGRQPPGWGVSR